MHSAVALLQWYIEAGVDEFIENEPHNRLLLQSSPLPAKLLPQPVPAPQSHPPQSHKSSVAPLHNATTLPVAQAIAEAEKLAAAASSIAELEKAVRGFDGLAIKRTAGNTVFADGNPASKLMLLGEAPGVEEDRRGIPFCGASGKLLDKMFAAIGRDRSRFYISNTLFWRPPGNRTPSTEELAICRPFVEKHIALVEPYLLVLIGGTALRGVLQESRGITRLRGKTLGYFSPVLQREIPVIATYHPSYLLRQPAKKREAWQDMLLIEEKMQKPDS